MTKSDIYQLGNFQRDYLITRGSKGITPAFLGWLVPSFGKPWIPYIRSTYYECGCNIFREAIKHYAPWWSARSEIMKKGGKYCIRLYKSYDQCYDYYLFSGKFVLLSIWQGIMKLGSIACAQLTFHFVEIHARPLAVPYIFHETVKPECG